MQACMFISTNIFLYWMWQSVLRPWREVSWISCPTSASECCAFPSSCQAVLYMGILVMITTCLSMLVISTLGWLFWVSGVKGTTWSNCKDWKFLSANHLRHFIRVLSAMTLWWLKHLIHSYDTLDFKSSTVVSSSDQVHNLHFIHVDALIILKYSIASSSFFLTYHSWLQLKKCC